MRCSNCGNTLPDSARFCSKCGTTFQPAETIRTERPSIFLLLLAALTGITGFFDFLLMGDGLSYRIEGLTTPTTVDVPLGNLSTLKMELDAFLATDIASEKFLLIASVLSFVGLALFLVGFALAVVAFAGKGSAKRAYAFLAAGAVAYILSIAVWFAVPKLASEACVYVWAIPNTHRYGVPVRYIVEAFDVFIDVIFRPVFYFHIAFAVLTLLTSVIRIKNYNK